MARLPRFVLPEYPQHVIQRGNNAQRILFDESDYWFLWERLGAGAKKFGCDIHAYALMPNHFHLLITPHSENGLGKLMQYVGRYYVQYFNQRYERTGTLWDGRYRATLIDPKDYFRNCARYVEENPVRAGLVGEPGAYDWSSFGAHGTGREDALVSPHPEYLHLGRSARARQEAWRALFATPMDLGLLERIRSATNKAWVLGDPDFVAEVESHLNRRALPRARGGDRRSAAYRQALAEAQAQPR
jgi:putative transposase